MKAAIFNVFYFAKRKDPQTGIRFYQRIGTTIIDDSCTSALFPLAAKAFAHAPDNCKSADKLEFVKTSRRC